MSMTAGSWNRVHERASERTSVATQVPSVLNMEMSSTMLGATSSLLGFSQPRLRNSLGEIFWNCSEVSSESCRATSVGCILEAESFLEDSCACVDPTTS